VRSSTSLVAVARRTDLLFVEEPGSCRGRPDAFAETSEVSVRGGYDVLVAGDRRRGRIGPFTICTIPRLLLIDRDRPRCREVRRDLRLLLGDPVANSPYASPNTWKSSCPSLLKSPAASVDPKWSSFSATMYIGE